MERIAENSLAGEPTNRRQLAQYDRVGRLRRPRLYDFDGDFVSRSVLPACDSRCIGLDSRGGFNLALSSSTSQSIHVALLPDPRISSLKLAIEEEGFDLVGITAAVESVGHSKLLEWIEKGYCGEMDYLASRADAYRHPRGVLASTASLIVMTFPYPAHPPPDLPKGHGRIARYAWPGTDYHDTIHPKLKRLRKQLEHLYPDAQSRGIVDTAPLMEREVAELAGVGWRAKNTLVINKHRGSFFFLACLLTDQVMPYDQPHPSHHCGTCTACLDACPTDAFPQAGVLNASRCISYLTIEHREAIPMELRSGIGDWLFGCDICQEVCPWNAKRDREIGSRPESPPHPLSEMELGELFQLDEDTFRVRFRKTPLWRTRRRGILRNAAIVLGNQGEVHSLSALTLGIEDEDGMVRGASAWAIGQIGGIDAIKILKQRLEQENDAEVLLEIKAALR